MKIFGEMGVLADDGEKVQCHICGKRYRKLGPHINPKHGIDCDDYRAKFGLAKCISLASEAHRELQNERVGKNLISGPNSPGCLALKNRPRRAAGEYKQRLSTELRIKENMLSGVNVINRPDVKAKAVLAMKSTEAVEKKRATLLTDAYRTKRRDIAKNQCQLRGTDGKFTSKTTK